MTIVVAGGCATGYGIKGLPDSATHLGHGEGFRYTPATDGMMYVVRDKQVVVLRQLRKGEAFEALGSAPGVDPNEFKRNEYYFLPGELVTPK